MLRKRILNARTQETRFVLIITITCVCWGMFRKLLSRDPMLTNLLGAVEPGVEYAEKERRRETENINKKQKIPENHQKSTTFSIFMNDSIQYKIF